MLLHQHISFYSHKDFNIKVHGKLMGWTDGDNEVNCENVNSLIKAKWVDGGEEALANLMRGIVGPCMIEVSTTEAVWLFASCSSSGYYWMQTLGTEDTGFSYLVSNEEGKFLREALRMGGALTEGAVMNAVLSHQSVIRPPFTGLVDGTHRCPPGFYVNFTLDKANLHTYLISKQTKKRRDQDVQLSKNMSAVANVYESYCKHHGLSAMMSFSGGVDSTALLLLHKKGLDKNSQGYYIDSGKFNEKKSRLRSRKKQHAKSISLSL